MAQLQFIRGFVCLFAAPTTDNEVPPPTDRPETDDDVDKHSKGSVGVVGERSKSRTSNQLTIMMTVVCCTFSLINATQTRTPISK